MCQGLICETLIIFLHTQPGYSSNFFPFLLIYGGLVFFSWGLEMVFCGLGFSVDGVLSLWGGSLWVF